MIPALLGLGVVTGGAGANAGSNPADSHGILREPITKSCELLTPVTVHDRGPFVSLELVDTGEELFSPQLRGSDQILVEESFSGDILKHAKTSGFRVVKSKIDGITVPKVSSLNTSETCPSVDDAARSMRDDRVHRRSELQSKLHRPGMDGVTPPVPLPTDTRKEDSARAAGTVPKSRMEGTTLLEVVIGMDGNIPRLKVIRSLNPELDAKAIETVRTWRFTPATKNGLPVPVIVNVEFNFHLR